MLYDSFLWSPTFSIYLYKAKTNVSKYTINSTIKDFIYLNTSNFDYTYLKCIKKYLLTIEQITSYPRSDMHMRCVMSFIYRWITLKTFFYKTLYIIMYNIYMTLLNSKKIKRINEFNIMNIIK